jgi:uncharacterized protein (DUF983 family)
MKMDENTSKTLLAVTIAVVVGVACFATKTTGPMWALLIIWFIW